MDKDILKILGLYRAEYEKAKINDLYANISQLCVAIMVIISIFVTTSSMIYILTILTLIAAFISWLYSFKARHKKSISDRARRIVLAVEGLGYRVTNKIITDLIFDFSASEEEGKKWEDEDYFRSNIAPGHEKLSVILQESIFFSKHLFKLSSKYSWIIFILFLSFSIIVLLLLPFLKNPSSTIQLGRVIIVVLIFLVSIDLFGRALKFTEASHNINIIDERIELCKISKKSNNDLLVLYSDYNSIVESTPIISTLIYKCYREKLNRLWEKRINTTKSK